MKKYHDSLHKMNLETYIAVILENYSQATEDVQEGKNYIIMYWTRHEIM